MRLAHGRLHAAALMTGPQCAGPNGEEDIDAEALLSHAQQQHSGNGGFFQEAQSDMQH
jgi:hypothetical protein